MRGAIDDVLLANSQIALDAGSPMDFQLGTWTTFANDHVGDREFTALADVCVEMEPRLGDFGVPAGPDGCFFPADDPWIVDTLGATPLFWAKRERSVPRRARGAGPALCGRPTKAARTASRSRRQGGGDRGGTPSGEDNRSPWRRAHHPIGKHTNRRTFANRNAPLNFPAS